MYCTNHWHAATKAVCIVYPVGWICVWSKNSETELLRGEPTGTWATPTICWETLSKQSSFTGRWEIHSVVSVLLQSKHTSLSPLLLWQNRTEQGCSSCSCSVDCRILSAPDCAESVLESRDSFGSLLLSKMNRNNLNLPDYCACVYLSKDTLSYFYAWWLSCLNLLARDLWVSSLKPQYHILICTNMPSSPSSSVFSLFFLASVKCSPDAKRLPQKLIWW